MPELQARVLLAIRGLLSNKITDLQRLLVTLKKLVAH